MGSRGRGPPRPVDAGAAVSVDVMYSVFVGLVGTMGGLAFIWWAVILRAAFRANPADGLLYLFFPPYAIYYTIARFDHDLRFLALLCLLLGTWGTAALLVLPRYV